MIVNDDHLLFIVHKKKIIIPFGTKIVLTRGETDWGQGGIRSGKFGWFYMVFLRKKGEQEAFPFCVCNPECLKLIVQYLDCTSNFDLFEVYDRQ